MDVRLSGERREMFKSMSQEERLALYLREFGPGEDANAHGDADGDGGRRHSPRDADTKWKYEDALDMQLLPMLWMNEIYANSSMIEKWRNNPRRILYSPFYVNRGGQRLAAFPWQPRGWHDQWVQYRYGDASLKYSDFLAIVMSYIMSMNVELKARVMPVVLSNINRYMREKLANERAMFRIEDTLAMPIRWGDKCKNNPEIEKVLSLALCVCGVCMECASYVCVCLFVCLLCVHRMGRLR